LNPLLNEDKKKMQIKSRHATPTSRPVSMIFPDYNLNRVIDVRPRW